MQGYVSKCGTSTKKWDGTMSAWTSDVTCPKCRLDLR